MRNLSIRITKFFIGSLVFCGMALFFLYNNNLGNRFQTKLTNTMNQFAIGSGFVIKNLYLQGENNSSLDEKLINKLLEVADIDVNQSIFKHSPQEIKKNLSKLPWVKNIVVDRTLPNNLYITFEERKPIAIKQFNRKLSLIDEEGIEYNPEEIELFMNYPIIVSEDAEVYAKTLIDILSTEKKIFEKINSIVHVGHRRWNIILKNNTIIKLPEYNMEQKWNMLVKMVNNNDLKLEDYKVIDLKINKRMFLERFETN